MPPKILNRKSAQKNLKIDRRIFTVYPNNLKNWFSTASALPQNDCPCSCLASRQWSLAPDKNFEEPPGQIPNFSSCLGIQPAYGWIKKGVRKEIPANTGRERLNLSGVIDVVSHNIVIQEDQTLNGESTIRFFKKIEEAYPSKRKIHIFCDNAPYYRNKAVKQSLETSKICLHFLPPYSPNLNPIERLWKWMKERVTYNTYYEHFEDFKGAIFGFFAVLSTVTAESVLGQALRGRVRDKFRPIGAPAANF